MIRHELRFWSSWSCQVAQISDCFLFTVCYSSYPFTLCGLIGQYLEGETWHECWSNLSPPAFSMKSQSFPNLNLPSYQAIQLYKAGPNSLLLSDYSLLFPSLALCQNVEGNLRIKGEWRKFGSPQSVCPSLDHDLSSPGCLGSSLIFGVKTYDT